MEDCSSSKDGNYKCLVISFCLFNASAVFPHFVNKMFQDVHYKYALVYLDGIFIFPKDLKSCCSPVQSLLAGKSHVCLTREIHIWVSKITFLGFHYLSHRSSYASWESFYSHELGTACCSKSPANIPRICKLLLSVHSELFIGHLGSHSSSLKGC